MNNNFNILNQIGRFIQNAANQAIKPAPPPPQNNQPFKVLDVPKFSEMNPSEIMSYYLQDIQTKNMEITQSVNYMKDMLNLPKDFKDLISKLTNSNTLNIDINSIKELFSASQKEALQKIIQQMADMARKNLDTTQLRDIMAIISSPNAADTAKAILLLYIPFLPLSVKPENLDWEINKKDEDEKNKSEDEIKILISTKKFQNVKITMYALGSTVDIIISANSIFPYKNLEEYIKNYSKENNFSLKIAFEEIKQENIKNEKQSVKIVSGQVLNSCVMLIMQALINFVLNIDNKE